MLPGQRQPVLSGATSDLVHEAARAPRHLPAEAVSVGPDRSLPLSLEEPRPFHVCASVVCQAVTTTS